MAKVRMMVENFVSRLSTRRKAQILDIISSYIAEVAYYRLWRQGFRPNGIIDIGAYHGEWTRGIARIYQNVPILMIEAQSEKRNQLEAVCEEIPNVSFELTLVGNKERSDVIFNVMETGSSLYNERSNVPRTQRTLSMSVLDNIIKSHPKLKSPFLLKLDVQGAELDVLMGGSDALKNAEIVQLEVALVNYNDGAPDLSSVVNFMSERGFVFFDVCGYVRPDPRFLSQIDVLFVRRGSTLRPEHFVFKL